MTCISDSTVSRHDQVVEFECERIKEHGASVAMYGRVAIPIPSIHTVNYLRHGGCFEVEIVTKDRTFSRKWEPQKEIEAETAFAFLSRHIGRPEEF